MLEMLLDFEKELGEGFITSEPILSILKQCLEDRVFTVRQAALKVVSDLSHRLGGKWCEKYFYPSIIGYLNHTNYLYRETAYFGIKVE